MSRDKREAQDAIKFLERYLKRDPGGMQRLNAITRFIGTLRQTLTSLKVQSELERSSIASLKDEVLRLNKERIDVETKLNAAVGARAQISHELRIANNTIEQLRLELEPDDVIKPDAEFPVSNRFNEMVKFLKRRMPKPPKLGRIVKESDRIRLFDLEKIISDFSEHQLLVLGTFVAVIVAAGFPMAIRSKTKAGRELPEHHTKRLIQWIRQWIGSTAEQDRKFFAMEEARARVASRGQLSVQHHAECHKAEPTSFDSLAPEPCKPSVGEPKETLGLVDVSLTLPSQVKRKT